MRQRFFRLTAKPKEPTWIRSTPHLPHQFRISRINPFIFCISLPLICYCCCCCCYSILFAFKRPNGQLGLNAWPRQPPWLVSPAECFNDFIFGHDCCILSTVTFQLQFQFRFALVLYCCASSDLVNNQEGPLKCSRSTLTLTKSIFIWNSCEFFNNLPHTHIHIIMMTLM